MKKICVFLLLVVSMFAFVGCVNDEGEKTDPAINGYDEQINLNVGDKLDLLTGVTAIGYKNDDLTASIKVNHTIPVDSEGNVTTAGTYNVKYSLVINDDTIATVYRTVVVTYVRPDDSGIIDNGDFESGSTDPFTKSEFEGGVATVSVVDDGSGNNNVLKVDVTAVNYVSPASPRIEQKISLDATKIYEVSFDAYAAVARTMHVQLGELLSADPWFKDIDPVSRFFELTTESQEFSFRFKPNMSLDPDITNVSITFEFGKMPDGNSAVTQCFLDNIKIIEVDSLGEDVTAPSLTITGNDLLYIGSEFIALNYVTVSDDQDENPTVSIVTEESELPELDENNLLTTAGDYKVVYKAVDASDNEAKITYNFTVVAPAQAGDELIKNNDFSKVTSGSLDNWIVYADAGCALTQAVSDGILTLTINNAAATVNYNPQFKQIDLEVLKDKNYKLTITLESSIDRDVEIAIQNNNTWSMHLDKIVSLVANTPQTLSYTFTGIEPSDSVLFFLGLGKINDKVSADNHTLKVSGLSLKETSEEVKDETAPIINVSGPKKYYVGDEFTTDVATATDNVDGEVEVTIDNTNSILPTLVEGLLTEIGEYKVIYKAVDEAGNEETYEYEFVVVEKPAEAPQLIVMEELLSSVNDEATAKANPNSVAVWYDQGGWCGASCVATATLEDGVLKVTSDQGEESCWFATQVFLYTNELTNRSYILKFNLEIDVAATITINGETIEVVAGTNDIEVKVPVSEEDTIKLSLQFGVEGVGNIGSVNAEISDIKYAISEEDDEEIQKLAAPEGVVANSVPEGYSIAFAAVTNATSYKYFLYNGEILVKEDAITNGGTIATPAEAGTYKVFVKAIGDGETYSDSDLSTSFGTIVVVDDNEEVILDAPVGVVANSVPEGYCIAFAAVANATNYKVYLYLNDTEVNVYTINNGGVIPAPTEAGTYTVKVQSLGNGSNIKDSEISESFATFTIE